MLKVAVKNKFINVVEAHGFQHRFKSEPAAMKVVFATCSCSGKPCVCGECDLEAIQFSGNERRALGLGV